MISETITDLLLVMGARYLNCLLLCDSGVIKQGINSNERGYGIFFSIESLANLTISRLEYMAGKLH